MNKQEEKTETTEKKGLLRGKTSLDPGNTLLVELRPILYIHLHPQTSKRFHLRFHLGRADHSERVK